MKDRKEQLAGTLSGGEQQMLAIGRALISIPKLLMLDEPSLGLMPTLVTDVRHALELADRGYVLETGRITLSDKGRNLLRDERVKKAYLVYSITKTA